MKNIGFAARHAPNHVRAFYTRLIEYFAQELGDDFEVVPEEYDGVVSSLDGRYRLVIFGTRGAAAEMVAHCNYTKSLLIDHGPVHTNRAPHSMVHFEIFSSPYLNNRYPGTGMAPAIKSWSGGYFLSDHLDNVCPRPGECLVYLIHNTGWKANSLTLVPFDDLSTIRYLAGLAAEFDRVHVVSHLNGGENFAVKYRAELPEHVIPVAHGPHFMNLVNNVEAVFFEYSSVIAAVLWNPRVKLFYRVPPYPCGPITLHATFLHELLEVAAYLIVGDDLSQVRECLISDPKLLAREEAKRLVFDESISDPYKAALDCVREALQMVINQEEASALSGEHGGMIRPMVQAGDGDR